MTEDQHQMAVIEFCKLHPWGENVHHSANEQKNGTSFAILNKLKKMGMSKGFPDIFLFIPNSKYSGFALELKSKGRKPTYQQQVWLDKLKSVGYYSTWSDDLDKSIAEVKSYIELPSFYT